MRIDKKAPKSTTVTENTKAKDIFWKISEKYQGLVKIVDMRAVMK